MIATKRPAFAAADRDDHRQTMRVAVNAVAAARGLPEPWQVDPSDNDTERARVSALGDLSTWGAGELGTLREELLSSADRSASGAWYTPPEIAHPITRAALSTITDLALDDDSATVLDLSLLDPACGSGVFLIAAARILARAYVSLLYGTHEPSELTIRMVMPTVMRACIYGIDTDPVAVDLAKAACWLETGGTVPIDWFDDNIICGNALDGDVPPALTARLGGTGPLAIVGNPPYKDKAAGQAPWIEARRPGPGKPRSGDELWRPSLDEFRLPGNGRVEYGLSNLHVFFWRWALWRAFETRLGCGVIAFLSPNSWLHGKGFAGMRSAMRRAADQGLIIDLTPEGVQPPVPTRVFPGVAQPLCAAIFTRFSGPQPDATAHVKIATVTGTRAEKTVQIEHLLRPAGGDGGDPE